MNWEVGTDINALPYVKQRASGDLVCNKGSSAQYSVINWRDGRQDRGSKGRIYTHIYSKFTLLCSRK